MSREASWRGAHYVLRLIVVAVAMVASLCAVFTTPAGAAIPSPAPQAYVYDGHQHAVLPSYTISKRGPSAATYDYTALSFAAAASNGPSARPQPGSNWTYTAYDVPTRFVQVDSGSGTTRMASDGAAAQVRTVPGASVAAHAADDRPILSGIVRDAAKCKGNFGLGSGTASQAERPGQAWVGDGFSVASDGKTLISRDGLCQWRPPSYKPNLDKWQSNFESRLVPRGQWQGNGHLDITDLP